MIKLPEDYTLDFNTFKIFYIKPNLCCVCFKSESLQKLTTEDRWASKKKLLKKMKVVGL